MRFVTRIAFAILLLLAVHPTRDSAASRPLLHVAGHWPVAGDGGWDALLADTAANRLYLSHGTAVDVVDLRRGAALGHIDSTLGVHGIAVARELRRGFISCGRDSSLLVFDLETLRPLQRVAVTGRNPDAILYESVSRRVLTFNGGGDNATVVDAATGRVLGTIDIGGKPEFAVADGRGKVFVNVEDKSEVAQIDPSTLKLERRWSIAPGEEPSGIAFDRRHRRLFSVCGNQKMVVSDTDSGRVVATLPIGNGVDGVVFDPQRGLAVSSNGEGTVTVVREESGDRFSVAETDSTERGARTVALDERSGRVFVVTAGFGPPPAPTPERPRPRPTILPGTFHVLVLEP